MNKIIKVKSVEELLEYMDTGYLFTVDKILHFFNIKKTQYYDYISNNVTRIKVPIAIRRELEKYSVDNDYLQYFINYMILTNNSVLLNFDEVFYYMIIKNDLKIELFNHELNEYDEVTTDYIINSGNHAEMAGIMDLLERAFVKSDKWQDFRSDFINSGKDEVDNYKTLQSRFYARISQYNHFRFKVLGVYCYAVIEDIDKDIHEMLRIKKDSYEFIKKFRST